MPSLRILATLIVLLLVTLESCECRTKRKQHNNRPGALSEDESLSGTFYKRVLSSNKRILKRRDTNTAKATGSNGDGPARRNEKVGDKVKGANNNKAAREYKASKEDKETEDDSYVIQVTPPGEPEREYKATDKSSDTADDNTVIQVMSPGEPVIVVDQQGEAEAQAHDQYFDGNPFLNFPQQEDLYIHATNNVPSQHPSEAPSKKPTFAPTDDPSKQPSTAPTADKDPFVVHNGNVPASNNNVPQQQTKQLLGPGCHFRNPDSTITSFEEGQSMGIFSTVNSCANNVPAAFPGYCISSARNQTVYPYCFYRDAFNQNICGRSGDDIGLLHPNRSLIHCQCFVSVTPYGQTYDVKITSNCDMIDLTTPAPTSAPGTLGEVYDATAAPTTPVPTPLPTAAPTTGSPTQAPTKAPTQPPFTSTPLTLSPVTLAPITPAPITPDALTPQPTPSVPVPVPVPPPAPPTTKQPTTTAPVAPTTKQPTTTAPIASTLSPIAPSTPPPIPSTSAPIAPTLSPVTTYPTFNSQNAPLLPEEQLAITYQPGNLTVFMEGLWLSKGLSARILARAGQPVSYKNSIHGMQSDEAFHPFPDGAAVFNDNRPGNSGGWIYVSNSEMKEGGVGAVTFNANGDVIHYRQILFGTKYNCNGGRTPWGSWVTAEEDFDKKDGKLWQIDPYGVRQPQQLTLGAEGGAFEAFAYDIRDLNQPRFFASEDDEEGCLRRWTPTNPVWGMDPWPMLHGPGVTEYLILQPDYTGTSGTYYWTTNEDSARDNAKQFYRYSEGIDVTGSYLRLIIKNDYRLFTLDLDQMTYTSMSTRAGLFDGEPDQINAILQEDGSTRIYFSEDWGQVSGIHARDDSGNIATILEGPQYSPETTGISFSPDGRRMYFTFQENGVLFEVTRNDGVSFHGRTVNLKPRFSENPATHRRRK